MSKAKPRVVVTRRLPDVVETRMRELFDTELNIEDEPMSSAQLAEAVKTARSCLSTNTPYRHVLSLEASGLARHLACRHKRAGTLSVCNLFV